VNGIDSVVPADNQDNINVLQLDQESENGQQQQQPMVNGNGLAADQQGSEGGSPLAPGVPGGLIEREDVDEDDGLIDLDVANLPLPAINGIGNVNGNGNHINGTLPANLPLPNITLNAPQDSDDDDYQALFDNWDGVYANPDDGFGFGDHIEFGGDIGMPNPNEGADDEIEMSNTLNGATLNGEAEMPNPIGTAPNDEAEMQDSLGNGTMPNGV
jgi:hypothetical protein